MVDSLFKYDSTLCLGNTIKIEAVPRYCELSLYVTNWHRLQRERSGGGVRLKYSDFAANE
jgi:hypothetical protein